MHVNTRLVEVGVTAYDKNGQPVTDLSRDDFELSDNSKRQVLRSFGRACAEVEGPLKAAADAQPILYSNRFDVKISAQSARTCVAENSTVILLDATRLGIAHFTRVREEILKFLERLPASESVGLYVRNRDGFRVLAEATANHDALSSALQKWMPHNEELAPGRKEATRNLQLAEAAQTTGDMNYMNGTIGGSANGTQNVSSVWEIPGGGSVQVDPKLMADDIQKTRQSLIVIGAVAAHMAAIPGHKNLVWLAGDSVLADWTDQTAGSSNGPYSLSSAAMRTQEALNDARVSLYPLGASQIEATAIDATLKNSSAQAREKSKQTAHSVDGAFQKMAEATGGRSFSKSENIVTGLINVIEDGQATYLLSFTPSAQPDDQFHWLRINLPKRRGITLRYRVGYLYSEELTTLKDRFNQVIWQPLDATEIALSVRRTSASVGSTVSLNISAQDISLVEQGDRRTGKLDIFFVQRDQAGRRAEVKEQTLALDLRTATYERLLQDGIPFDQHFDDKQNSGIVRIIVVDENSGRIGSVTLPAAN